MPCARIEDYALIGDCQTAALVGRDGSIDWLCFPRFDSGACFAALLGGPEHGRFLLRPSAPVIAQRRRYAGDTLILESTYETAQGAVTITDFMPPRDGAPDLVRIVRGVRGKVAMRAELVIRFDYGALVPWVRQLGRASAPDQAAGPLEGLEAVAGPDRVVLYAPPRLRGENFKSCADFEVREGEAVPFHLSYTRSTAPSPRPIDAFAALAATERFWRQWAARCDDAGPYREAVMRSLITLKALTHEPTGGIVAAPTTSLPEQPGGMRNWDYRYCWLRDATFTLSALLENGYRDEAKAWQEWLRRAVAGAPSQLQIMYGVAGERRLTELALDWLPGFAHSRPVRIGNAASAQRQLDVFGEVLDTLHLAGEAGLDGARDGWALARALVGFLEEIWREPDEGIWEVRGGRRHFTHSKVMAWVAFDRAIKSAERHGLDGPVERWRTIRAEIHRDVCARGFDATQGSFVQYYGGRHLDASLLMLALVGFLPPDDRRIAGTVAAVEKMLVRDGLVQRYQSESGVDGLPPGEGAFLACTFWLVDNLVLQGRRREATQLFERLLALQNDVGLFAEEYDPRGRAMRGNFPQAFSHVALLNSARRLLPPREQRYVKREAS